MSKMIDLTGQRFGRLTVLGYSGHKDKDGRLLWTCKCDCGNIVEKVAHTMKAGRTLSCGCLLHERKGVPQKHGWCLNGGERLYFLWKKMINRCVNPKDVSYPNYGGRGISVCDEWKTDYMSFRKWAYANGYNDKAAYRECTIDRIDNEEGYSPENCRWVPWSTQCNNRRVNHYITYNGETMSMSDACRKYGLPVTTLRYRIDNGWDLELALTTKKGAPKGYGKRNRNV